MHLVQAPGKIDRRTVGQVPAVGQVHAEDAVTRAQDAEVGRHVGLGARMRLHVHVFRAREERQGPLLRQDLGKVDVFASTVVALAGKALRVLVGEPGSLRLHHGGEGVVLARDELDLVVLAPFAP